MIQYNKIDFEKLEDNMCDTSNALIAYLESTDSGEGTKALIEGIHKIKQAFMVKPTEEDITKIFNTLLQLYELVVYRGGKQERASGLVAYKVFIFSIHGACLQTNNKSLLPLCSNIEKDLLDMTDVEIKQAIGIENTEQDVYMVDKVGKIYTIITMFLLGITCLTEILSLIFGNGVNYTSLFFIGIVIVICIVLLKVRKGITAIDVSGLKDTEKETLQLYVKRKAYYENGGQEE